MPGLSALQQFNADMLNLGDEVKIRSARGEKPVTIPIPQDIQDVDDKEDFKLGMPVLSEEEQAQADAAEREREREANDFSDITGSSEDEEVEELQQAPVNMAEPDVSDLLSASSLSLDDLDLSDFEEPEEKKPEPPKEIPIEDLDLDALLAPRPKPEPAPKAAPKQAPRPAPKPAPKPAVKQPPKPAPAPVKDEPAEDLKSVDALEPLEPLETAEPAQTASAPDDPFSIDIDEDEFIDQTGSMQDFKMPDTEALLSGLAKDIETPDVASESTVSAEKDTVPEMQDLPESSGASDTSAVLDDLPDFNDDFADFDDNVSSIDMNEGIPNEFIEVPDEPVIEKPRAQDAAEEPAVEEPAVEDTVTEEPGAEEDSFEIEEPAVTSETSSFDEPSSDELPEDPFAGMDFSPEGEAVSNGGEFSFDEPVSGDSGEDVETSSAGEGSDSAFTDDPFSTDGLDSFDSSNSSDDFSLPDFGDESADAQAPDATDSVPEETFDTSDIADLNFEGQEDTSSDFEMGEVNGVEDDDAFFIPGFSDTQTADIYNTKKQTVETPDFSDALQGENGKDKPKNTFTDAEYKRFLKNLSEYPLNVRIAVEDLVVKNELTDDAVFSVLDKVLRKVPARTLASELNKLLDISLEVPRDFERRSATEYEAYKKSIEYQLKNKIIPGAILTAFAAVILFCFYVLITNFIYEPAMANHLYKQGYELLQQEQYPQSQERFKLALNHRVVKKWFFKYARGYREHRQYDRSRNMYDNILKAFNHDKAGGLEWADMEGFELYNYEEAERILKREVLDYHINDPDAMLMLGDLYLDWGTEVDPSKLALAKQQYDLLIQLYGSSNQYLAREMRYFIRTDNLRQVLMYKNIFYSDKKSLGAQDLTELSGFLLDKRYGKLRTSEESLRLSIENVRELLERAVKADPSNPVALYNMGRYFVETSNGRTATRFLKSAISNFESEPYRSKKDTYKFINSYRLLGEEYRNEREYILAEESYGKGIDLFESENAHSGFESDENVGRLYADIADLDYFIAADNDNALKNYINAVNNKYDNSSVRYRIGYIQYQKENYSQALGSFILSHETNKQDPYLLLALANTLSLSSDNYVARGYYENLVENLNTEREVLKARFNSGTPKQAEINELYMKATNNLGVTLSRIADQTGDSSLNAKAIVNLQESLRAWDAITRNPETMIRLEGSNLAEQNVKYITNPYSDYKPEIYTEISRVLSGEEILD